MKGELISLTVALMWAGSALFFEYAGRAIKAVNLNLIRLIFALFLIGIILFFINGSPFPQYANGEVWFWMSLSGFVGFVFGDFFLFSSYRTIPARVTQLIMTLAPPFSALAGFILLGERLSTNTIIGMVVTLSGIALSILKRDSKSSNAEQRRGVHLELPVKGVLFALLAAIGQGVGLVLSKIGLLAYKESVPELSSLYTSLAGTQIRIIIGIISFTIIIAFIKNGFKGFFASFKAQKNIAAAFGGSIVGPVVGVTLSLLAVQYTNIAVASTIMALVPIIIIIPDCLIYKRRVTFIEVLGAIISVAGVAILLSSR